MDNGGEFCGEAQKHLFNYFGIYVSHVSPLRPCGNRVERVHRELVKLYKIYQIPITSWDIFLPIILYYYNTQESISLNNLCPFQALYLRSPRDPLSLNCAKKLAGAWMDNFGSISELIFRDMGKYFRQQYTHQTIIDSTAPNKLKKGEWVLAYKHTGGPNKTRRKYHGPYVVKKQTSPGVYLLVNLATNKHIKRNIDLVRRIPKQTFTKSDLIINRLPTTADPDTTITDASNTPDIEHIITTPNIPDPSTNRVRQTQITPSAADNQYLTQDQTTRESSARPSRKRNKPGYLLDYDI